jgi:hypothetical protein
VNTATKIRKLAGWKSDAALYRTEPPLDGNEYVVVSAVDLANRFPVYDGAPRSMQIETYIFAADKDGAVSDYCELSGSMKGTLDHADALRDAGYELTQ